MKKDYMTRLEQAARWRLPWQEAEDVIADYRDIVGVPPRPDGELLRDLGKPWAVVRPLAQLKPYRTWLAAFFIMAACILLPALGPWPFMNLYYPELFGPLATYELYFRPLWHFFFDSGVPMYRAPFILGLVLPLVWFQRQGGKPRTSLPRSIPIVMAVLLASMAWPWWLFMQIYGYPDAFLWQFPTVPGQLFQLLLQWGGFAAAVTGVAALVKSRIRDRRWRAVYTLALTVAMVYLTTEALLSSMDVTDSHNVFQALLTEKLVITIAGLAAAAVSLLLDRTARRKEQS